RGVGVGLTPGAFADAGGDLIGRRAAIGVGEAIGPAPPVHAEDAAAAGVGVVGRIQGDGEDVGVHAGHAVVALVHLGHALDLVDPDVVARAASVPGGGHAQRAVGLKTFLDLAVRGVAAVVAAIQRPALPRNADLEAVARGLGHLQRPVVELPHAAHLADPDVV